MQRSLIKADLRPMLWTLPLFLLLTAGALLTYRFLNGSFDTSPSVIVGSPDFGTLHPYPATILDTSAIPAGNDVSDPEISIPTVELGGPWNLMAGMANLLYIFSLGFGIAVSKRVKGRLGAGVTRRSLALSALATAVTVAAIHSAISVVLLLIGDILDDRTVLGSSMWMYLYIPLWHLVFFAWILLMTVFSLRYGGTTLIFTILGLWLSISISYGIFTSYIGASLANWLSDLHKLITVANPAIAMTEHAALLAIIPALGSWCVMRRMRVKRK
ncbi:hypothetical protein [Arcanobacterium canis]